VPTDAPMHRRRIASTHGTAARVALWVRGQATTRFERQHELLALDSDSSGSTTVVALDGKLFTGGMSTQERDNADEAGRPSAAVDLYWIPLGAGQHVVRLSGKLFEAMSARIQGRRPCDLYHSALVIFAAEGRFVIEQTPVPDAHGERRGAVLEGAVGSRLAGRFRLFRYEVRRWRDGVIPDIAEAVASPVRVTENADRASQVLNLVPSVPALVWGRDESHTGDMWNSNSVISWLLVRAGLDTDAIQPPPGGRAPGWRAGLELATSMQRGSVGDRDDQAANDRKDSRDEKADREHLLDPRWGHAGPRRT
jgi:hypothetical protein